MPLLEIRGVPDWATNALRPRLSSQFDFAYRIRPSINILDTRLSGAVKMTGPGYQSLGASFIRTDVFGWEVTLDRSFADNQISLAGSFNTERDNLTGLRSYTDTFTSGTANIGVSFAALPSANLNFSSSRQTGDSAVNRFLNWG